MRDEKILLAIKDKDEQMIATIINKYSKLMWKIVSSVLANVGTIQDIEECVADVFIDFWLHPEKFDTSRGKLSSWLSMVARSKALDRYRKIVRTKEVSIEEETLVYYSEILAGLLREEETEKLIACVESLGSMDREILVRRFFYEQKPREIAVALNISRKQVENHLYQAKIKLKKMME